MKKIKKHECASPEKNYICLEKEHISPLQPSKEEREKEFDNILDSAKWAFRTYGNQNGFKDQNAYADKEVTIIKDFIRKTRQEAKQETIEKIKQWAEEHQFTNTGGDNLKIITNYAYDDLIDYLKSL